VRFSKFPPRLIHNAIHTKSFRRTSPRSQSESLPLLGGGPVIGSIGRLSRQKGYRYLIGAMPKISLEFPDARLVIIGDGELRHKLEGQVQELGICEQVLFTGKVEDVMPYLRRMDLFVLPSLWEGFPTALMESMASDVPVIATDVPGTRELIQDQVNGWLVPAQDPHSLADAILDAFRNPQKRERFAEAAMRKVEQFDIASISREYERCYFRLLASEDDL
jgi:glycosyltransferase involved in cell wall biosynthesis